MNPLNRNRRWSRAATTLVVLASVFYAVPTLAEQSGTGQTQSPAPASQPAQNIPDAPSAVQPPPAKPEFPTTSPANPLPNARPDQPSGNNSQGQATEEKPTPPPMPPIETIPPGTGPPGSAPRNQINPVDDLYKLVVPVNFVQIPVMVKDGSGRRVDGLLPKDFTVLENGKKQTLTFFSADPFVLSVAILLDIGMPDVAVQKMNQTYSALVGSLSPYDEAALYTYSSTVSQVDDFTQNSEKLTATLNELKLVRGHNNGPAVLSGPFGPQPPMVNGIPVGTMGPPPVTTPPKEAHVLNDAILRAALDLSKRDRTRRRVILVISDGREFGSKASYRDVLKVLETYGIQVKPVVVDSGALPLFRQVEKIRIKDQGYSNILPKYASATGGGKVFSELSRNAIEDAYAEITSEARNQYTLGYNPKATTGSAAYRSIEVLVDKKVSVYAKDGYYPTPSAR